PYLPPTSQAKARALVERLTAWQYVSRLHLVPFGEIQREVVLSAPPPLRVVVYRRLMLRIAQALARRAGAPALVTGESLGQVASQTLENIACIDEAASLPVLRPLIGMDKLEITAAAQQIGTFEISIEPDADCCTLFTPRHPATRATLEEIRGVEAVLDVERLVAAGAEGATLGTFAFPGAGAAAPSACHPFPRDIGALDAASHNRYGARMAIIAIGADHAGYTLKERLKTWLSADGHRIIDHGTHSSESVDYPDYAVAVAESVRAGDAE